MKNTSKLKLGDIPGPDWQDALTTDTTIGFNFWERLKILFGCRVNVHMKTLCEISPGATQHWPEWSRICVLKHRWWPHKHSYQFVGEAPQRKPKPAGVSSAEGGDDATSER